MHATVECAVAAASVLGESPVWDAERSLCWWADIKGKAVHRLDPRTGADRAIPLSSMAGAIAMHRDGRLLVAAGHSIVILDPDDESVRPSGIDIDVGSGMRFNDGKCDAEGRFWVGTMSLDAAPGRGALYCVHADGTVETKLRALTISNGLAWHASTKTMYHVDTATRCVFAFDYEPGTTRIDGRRVAIEIPEGQGLPDGIALDAEGMLWIALWGGSSVARWNPRTGRELERIMVPATQVSSCAFGGDRLDTLFITTARDGLDDAELARQPLAGSLFACTTSTVAAEIAPFGGR